MIDRIAVDLAIWLHPLQRLTRDISQDRVPLERANQPELDWKAPP